MSQVLAIIGTSADLKPRQVLGSKELAFEVANSRSRRLTWIGFGVVAAFFGGLTAWSVLAPLDSAVLTAGQVVVANSRNAVQSERGGVVTEILHRDGDRVEAGQVLVRLDSTKEQATYQLLLVRYYEISALRARLLAERDGLERIEFPSELTASDAGPDSAAAVAGQTRVFNSRRQTILNQTAILNQQIEEFSAEIDGLKTQIAAQGEQLDLLDEETADTGELVEKGLSSKPRLLSIEEGDVHAEGQPRREPSPDRPGDAIGAFREVSDPRFEKQAHGRGGPRPS